MNFSSFRHKLRNDLRYRLMTAMLVSILPIAAISCILLSIVWNRAEQEIHQNQQARLDEAMSYWERDSRTVDRAMSYFASQFLPELNNENLNWDEITRYNMFSLLCQVLPEADHNGIVALHDLRQDKVMAQTRTDSQDAALIDRQVRDFTEQIQSGKSLQNDTWQMISGKYYLIERFSYHNAVAYFALDVGDSILERTEPLRDADTVVYVADGDRIIRLSKENAVETDLTWESCTRSTPRHSCLFQFLRWWKVWRSEWIPAAPQPVGP